MNPILKNILLNKGILPKSKIYYTSSTWVEWDKSAGVVGDATGLEFTSDGASYLAGKCALAFNPSAKYGVLYNVVSSTYNQFFFIRGYVSNSALSDTIIPKTVGDNKAIFTTSASPTSTLLGFFIVPTTAGEKIKIKNVRVIELPIGSRIDADFTKLTGEQLNIKYPFNKVNRR